ncbi:hypothetical protein ACLMJK_001388 [Lecanora helva]
MAKRFPGSVVLTLDAEGHCLLSSPSLCVAHYLRTYLHSGKLPEPDTVCDDNEKPFLGLTKRGKHEDEDLLEQLRWTASHLKRIEDGEANAKSEEFDSGICEDDIMTIAET